MWLKIAPNQSEQWQLPSIENHFCFLKFIQLFWVDLSRRLIAENMGYSHLRWGRPNWFSRKHFSIENGVLTIDTEKFQLIVADFGLRWQVFDSWRQSAQHFFNTSGGGGGGGGHNYRTDIAFRTLNSEKDLSTVLGGTAIWFFWYCSDEV